jgi:probable HAF family extracellular repeat protein
MRDLGTLGGVASYPTAINNKGVVVGSSHTAFLNPYGQAIDHAFIWRHGRMTDLGTLGGFFSRAHDINDKGQVVGVSDTDPITGEMHGFLWEKGKMKDLGFNFRPWRINNRGQIVGSNPDLEVLLWDRGKVTKVVDEGFPGGFNDHTTIAGESGGRNRHAVIWTR